MSGWHYKLPVSMACCPPRGHACVPPLTHGWGHCTNAFCTAACLGNTGCEEAVQPYHWRDFCCSVGPRGWQPVAVCWRTGEGFPFAPPALGCSAYKPRLCAHRSCTAPLSRHFTSRTARTTSCALVRSTLGTCGCAAVWRDRGTLSLVERCTTTPLCVVCEAWQTCVVGLVLPVSTPAV